MSNQREDIDGKFTALKGLTGLVEISLRRYKGFFHFALLIPLYLFASLCFGLALTPSVVLFSYMMDLASQSNTLFKFPIMGITLGVCYFTYGFSLILIIPFINKFIVGSLQPWRGPYYSSSTIKWYIHNGLTYLVRYTFLEFITPTPMNIFFFKKMGMKIGPGAQINSAHISDPSMIEMGKKVTIGGSANLIAHYGAGGYLVIAKTKIGDGVTIGLRATIMGGVEIGKGAKILPNSVVLPKTKIPAGETWGGVPAQPISLKNLAKMAS